MTRFCLVLPRKGVTAPQRLACFRNLRAAERKLREIRKHEEFFRRIGIQAPPVKIVKRSR